MCVNGSAIDATNDFGFKISQSNIQEGVTVNLVNVYYIENNYSFNPTPYNSTNITPILTILDNSMCSCQNVLFKVNF